ncbi:hypothetical protein KUV62_13785 [Salipiger bermudensis]|uniref:hypothetical protein n=1 Tax=Salipiger bermudensis TaxID=344736 RepID=UPI001C993C1F|nr:hypothetical protein [Salipiger bermudensis]MBY6004987.1 hypothetical protein [Salipiger bermudensis]
MTTTAPSAARLADCAPNFRHAIRRDTKTEHEALEAQFAPFMAAPERHLSWFLATQYAALGALLASRPAEAEGLLSGLLLTELVGRLRFDLENRGVIAPALDRAAESLDTVAIDYLVLGSRLGTETMRRQLFADHQREAIPQYFLIGTMPELWQRHCAELNTIEAGSPRAAKIIQDTKAGFAIFARAALTQA